MNTTETVTDTPTLVKQRGRPRKTPSDKVKKPPAKLGRPKKYVTDENGYIVCEQCNIKYYHNNKSNHIKGKLHQMLAGHNAEVSALKKRIEELEAIIANNR